MTGSEQVAAAARVPLRHSSGVGMKNERVRPASTNIPIPFGTIAIAAILLNGIGICVGLPDPSILFAPSVVHVAAAAAAAAAFKLRPYFECLARLICVECPLLLPGLLHFVIGRPLLILFKDAVEDRCMMSLSSLLD